MVTASCTSLYVPNVRNAPLFREQGEAQISTYLTSGGLEFQGAYAVTDHVAAIGSYAFGKANRSSPDYTWKNSYAELGLGYFDRSRSARYEVLGGYGLGQGTNYDQYYFFGLASVVSTAKMQRIFLQPSIGTNNRDVNIIFTPRFTMVTYSEFTDAVKTVKPNEKAQFFVEPALTLKFRLAGNLHGFCQLGIIAPVSGAVYFDYLNPQVAAGIQIDTGGLRTRVY